MRQGLLYKTCKYGLDGTRIAKILITNCNNYSFDQAARGIKHRYSHWQTSDLAQNHVLTGMVLAITCDRKKNYNYVCDQLQPITSSCYIFDIIYI